MQSGYPLGSGLLFTADHVSFFSMTTAFNGMQPQEYAEWLKRRRTVNNELESWEPVGCFEFDEKSEQLTVELDYKRPTR